jgi:hypothetical protein
MRIQGSQFEIHTPASWNVIGCSMSAAQPVLSLSSILPLPSSHYTFIRTRKRLARLKTLFFNLFKIV